ncbi:FTR1 family iron permease [Virgibacillus halodenitrificans]|uniref:FTR1 family iron permease n=1 Tax=Virgibacillus halodenitrificans TaxID=1482 RepID=UPI0024BF7BAD|nr:FTR1 family protein [Virgibacillus halodenitrificans]WHX25417.1 FTR1 family iron permease [Virgibacillus halodenitrificans]
MCRIKSKFLLISTILLINIFFYHNGMTASAEANFDELYIEIGDALLHAKKDDWKAVQEDIDAFEKLWTSIDVADKQMDHEINQLAALLHSDRKDGREIRGQLTNLSKTLVALDKNQNPNNEGKEKVGNLLALLDKMETALKDEQITEAAAIYDDFLIQWTKHESIVRDESITAYGNIETQIAFIRIGLSQQPPDLKKTMDAITSLKSNINDFLKGEVSKKKVNEEYTLQDAIDLLGAANNSISSNEIEKASESLNEFLLIWPVVEGEVRTRDPQLYTELENKVPKVIGMLQSKDTDQGKSLEIIDSLENRLRLISTKTSYTFMDALLILLREGMEAILIIAGLLAFLKKTNNESKKNWIWGGAVIGLIASIGLAVCINVFFSHINAATGREYMEGIIGLVAVIMMLTIGAWLHKKTNSNHWNHFVEKNLSKALAKGSLLSMAMLSFLSIFREGAETIIFYAGMAPSMEMSQLLSGIGLGTILLLIIGFIITRYSSKLPLKPFFFVATWVIYLLAFKMLGVSIHALQVANTLPIHYLEMIPIIDWAGLYPTVETLIPQLLFICIVIIVSIYIRITAKKLPSLISN